MRYFSLFSFLILTISLSASFVEAQETEILPLDDAISGLTEQDFANRAGAEDISLEIDAALDSAMVADALEQGLITQEEAGTLNQALEIIEGCGLAETYGRYQTLLNLTILKFQGP